MHSQCCASVTTVSKTCLHRPRRKLNTRSAIGPVPPHPALVTSSLAPASMNWTLLDTSWVESCRSCPSVSGVLHWACVSRLIHVLQVSGPQHPVVGKHRGLCIRSSVCQGHLNYFHPLAVVNDAAVKTCIQVPAGVPFSVLLDKHLDVG